MTIARSTAYITFFACSYIMSGMVLLTNFPSKLITPSYPYRPLTASSIALGSNLLGSVISSLLTNR